MYCLRSFLSIVQLAKVNRIRALARPLADPGKPDKVTRAVQEGPTDYGAQGDY